MKWTTNEVADLKKTVKNAETAKAGIQLFAEKSGRKFSNVNSKYYYLMTRKKTKKRKYSKRAPKTVLQPVSAAPIVTTTSDHKYLSFDMKNVKCVSLDNGVLTIFI